MITHSHISRVVVFLCDLLRGRVSSLHEFQMIYRCPHEDRLWVERFCELCKLTRLTDDAKDALSDRGRGIAQSYESKHDLEQAFRDILYEYICEARPAWANRIPAGREEAFASMNKDELFCFKEAGLACRPVTASIVAWWDEVAEHFRSHTDNDLVQIGRAGEKLTIMYELERTGRLPSWISVESNFAGYDILSCESGMSERKRLIEVKSTQKEMGDAEFYITRNEWETALTSINDYYFYLWEIGKVNKLAIVSASIMGNHVSKNVGYGRWISVSIPFRVFSEHMFAWSQKRETILPSS